LVPLSQKCDRPPGLSPAGARGARAADQVSPPMNEDVSRRGCFPETPEPFQPESASQTQHSAANSAKLVPLGQHPQPSAPATVETMDTAAQSLLNPSTTESAHPAGAAIVGATPSS
jgi:hypothetical protein